MFIIEDERKTASTASSIFLTYRYRWRIANVELTLRNTHGTVLKKLFGWFLLTCFGGTFRLKLKTDPDSVIRDTIEIKRSILETYLFSLYLDIGMYCSTNLNLFEKSRRQKVTGAEWEKSLLPNINVFQKVFCQHRCRVNCFQIHFLLCVLRRSLTSDNRDLLLPFL